MLGTIVALAAQISPLPATIFETQLCDMMLSLFDVFLWNFQFDTITSTKLNITSQVIGSSIRISSSSISTPIIYKLFVQFCSPYPSTFGLRIIDTKPALEPEVSFGPSRARHLGE